MKIILGSGSGGRQQLLKEAGLEFSVMSADIDEKSIRHDNFRALPLLLARAKSDALLSRISEDVVLITADSVVICNGELREKPASEDQARDFLKSYQRHPAEVVSSAVIVRTDTGEKREITDIGVTFFRPIPDDVIEEMIKEGWIFNGAGGFIYQDPKLKPYIDRIEGNEGSIIGLPMPETIREITDLMSN